MQNLAIGLIQLSVSDDMHVNLNRALDRAEEAVLKGAKIICLPELYRSVYFPQAEKADASCYAETIPGESTEAFSALAKDHEIVVLVPLFEKFGEEYYNSVAVIDADGKLLGTYRKVHIPHDPLFYEKNYFLPGDLRFRVFQTRYAKIAPLICYDQWFPEAARAVVLQGADIIFYPTAIGWIAGGQGEPAEGDWRDAWETVQRGHAIANGIHVAAVNRVGREGDIDFWGSSFVSDAFGKVLARAGDKDEEVLVAAIDLGLNVEVREGWGFLRNRRPEVYSTLTRTGPLPPAGKAPGIDDALLVEGEDVEGRDVEIGGATGSACQIYGSAVSGNTPKRLGFHMPAEWERHDGMWLSWPHDPDSFPNLPEVEGSYISIIRSIYESERVFLLVKDEEMRGRVVRMLEGAGVDLDRVKIYVYDYADVWFRDYGPTFVVNRDEGEIAMVNWIFNAWGEKYPELMADTTVPMFINQDLDMEAFVPGIVLEGGSIDVNGRGTVLTTEQCLLNRKRNPGLSKDQIEEFLFEYLGASKVIWLKEGITGDDTDGHVDDIARFVAPDTVICALEEDEGDENYGVLQENYQILSKSKDQEGHPLKVIPIPMPGRVQTPEGKRLPASYANFYIGNDVVLVPIFGHENDRRAMDIIGRALPGRKVVGINCRDLVHGLGTIHCISQQQPSL